jgi:hypothetical protein
MIPRPNTKAEKAAWRSILRCDRQQKPSLVIPRFSKPDPRQKKQVNRLDYKMCPYANRREKKQNPDVISRYYGLNFRQLQNTYSFLISLKQGRPGLFSSCQTLSRPLQVKSKSSQVWDRQRQGWLEKQGPVALKPELKDRQSHWFFCVGA